MIKNISIKTKLVVFIILMMFISGTVSACIIFWEFSGKIESESRNVESGMANSIIDLSKNTDFDTDKIIKLSNKGMFIVGHIDRSEAVDLAGELENGEYKQVKARGITRIKTIVKADDKYYIIQTNKNFQITNSYIGKIILISLGVSILIVSILTTLLSAIFIRPLTKLSEATEEVAKGNFDTRVDVPKDYEFGNLAENFNKMVYELGSIETLRNDFVSNVSHEMKTPIASIQGFIKLLKDDSFSKEEKDEFMDIIVSESERLSKLTSNVLKLSKIDNQDISIVKEKFSLDEQIRCVILILERSWSEKDLKLNIDLEKINIVQNEDLLQQVWLNLIENAIKFSSVGGEVTIKLTSDEENSYVEVTDNGAGMSEEIQKHIFEKFYQGDKSHLVDGNGLGLTLVKKIVELCSGDIYINSELGKGTTFTIKIKN